jgi:uncharacterized repeat protein (TIGR01451 family)
MINMPISICNKEVNGLRVFALLQTLFNDQMRNGGAKMVRTLFKTLLALTLGICLPLSVGAAPKPELVLKMKAEKEVTITDRGGASRTEWREVASLKPGELVRYTITCTNSGSSEARNPVIVDPVPTGTVYIAGSAEGKNSEITFSMDGRKFESAPLLKYRTKGIGVTGQEMVVTPEMYTHIRWKFIKPFPPGGSGWVSFKVKVR